ncbi:MAG: putative quinol monooxygenase [Candidatus Dormibacteria bacterium]
MTATRTDGERLRHRSAHTARLQSGHGGRDIYGSVSRWRVKDGQQHELEQLLNELMREMPPGSRGVSVYRSDADPQEYWVAGSWDSKDAYATNSNRPDTDANFRRFRALLESDPEWHDGEIILTRP